jgi:hypothetical protein
MTRNKILILICLALLVNTFSVINAQSRFVKVDGKRFLTASGQPLILKGMNLGNWLMPEGYMFKFKSATSPQLIQTVLNQLIGEDEANRFWKSYRDNYITKDDIDFIKRAGFNSVRVPFNYRLFVTEREPRKLEGPGYELLDRVINWCAEQGIYVILDMHAAPGGQTGDNIDDGYGYPFLFESADSQELTIRIWQKLATRYKNETAILGYDLLNEPIAHFFDVAYFNPRLEPLYKRITASVREVDKNHIIFIGGAQWDGNFTVFGAPFDRQLAYTFHKYWMEPTQSSVQDYVDFSNKYNVPIWLGESGENTDEWIKSFRLLLEKNDIGWCFWTYKRLDASACVASIALPENWDAVVNFANQPRATFEEVRKARPSKEAVTIALKGYLNNIRSRNCKINQGYLQALGLKP